MKYVFILCLFCFNLVWSKADLIVLDPAGVEILYLLGAEDRIQAIASLQQGKIYPFEQTEKLPSVGNYSKPSLEKIISLKPKMVILSFHSTNMQDDLNRVGIDSLILNANSLDEIIANIQTLAELTGKEEKAKEIIADFKNNLAQISAKPICKKGAFFYTSTPLMVFGKDTIPGDVLRILGVQNIGEDALFTDRPILNQEFVLKENPDFILYGIAVKDTEDLLRSNPLLKNTKAFRNQQMYYLETSSLLRGSPRILQEIKALYEKLSLVP